MAKKPPKLKPLQGLDWVTRTQLYLDHEGQRYTVSVDFFDWETRIDLFVGEQWLDTKFKKMRHRLSPNLEVDVNTSAYGMRHARLVQASRDLERGPTIIDFHPAPGSGELWRARLERDRPALSRGIAVASWLMVFLLVVTQIPIWINQGLDLLADAGMWQEVTLRLPVLAAMENPSTTVLILGVIALVERAWRFKYKTWFDGLAG